MVLNFHSISIRRKVTFVILVTCLFALLASGGVQLFRFDRQARMNLEQDLRIAADIMGQNFASALEFDDDIFPTEELQILRIDESIVSGALYDRSGELFATG